MLAIETDNMEIMNQAISGQRVNDHQVSASLADLTARLEALRQSSGLFAEITFSPHVESLAGVSAVAV